MDRHGAALLHPLFAGGERAGIAVALDDQVGAVFPDARDLGRRGNAGNEDPCRHLQRHRRIGHRRSVVAARGRNHAGRGNIADQEIGEAAPGLEGAGVLKRLQLEDDGLN